MDDVWCTLYDDDAGDDDHADDDTDDDNMWRIVLWSLDVKDSIVGSHDDGSYCEWLLPGGVAPPRWMMYDDGWWWLMMDDAWWCMMIDDDGWWWMYCWRPKKFVLILIWKLSFLICKFLLGLESYYKVHLRRTMFDREIIWCNILNIFSYMIWYWINWINYVINDVIDSTDLLLNSKGLY